MAGNTQIPQGTLNRLKASVTVPSFTQLNVTPPYLSKEGISLSFDGDSTVAHPTMTGTTQSPEPYIMMSITINLLKTNGLADIYKSQLEANSLIGDVTVSTDTTALSSYTANNVAILSPREVSLNGLDPRYTVMLRGYYQINNDLWAS